MPQLRRKAMSAANSRRSVSLVMALPPYFTTTILPCNWVNQGSAGCNHGLHGRVKEPEAISARGFCIVHREIGPLQQFVNIAVLRRKQGHANAGCTGIFIRIELKDLREGAENFFAYRFGLQGSGFCFLCTEIGEKNDKFIAAEAGNRIIRPAPMGER